MEGLNGVVGTDGGSIRVSMTIRRTVSAAFGQVVEGMDLMPAFAAVPAALFLGERFHLILCDRRRGGEDRAGLAQAATGAGGP